MAYICFSLFPTSDGEGKWSSGHLSASKSHGCFSMHGFQPFTLSVSTPHSSVCLLSSVFFFFFGNVLFCFVITVNYIQCNIIFLLSFKNYTCFHISIIIVRASWLTNHYLNNYIYLQNFSITCFLPSLWIW